MDFNPLNAELNPVCYLLALLGAHHILHVSRIRVKEIRYGAVFWFQLAYMKGKYEHGKCPVKCLEFLYRLRSY